MPRNYTPGRGKIVLCKMEINNQTSQLAGKAYKDSDYTVVITTMQLDKPIIIVLKLTLVVEI